ncbi:Uncharacterised protein [Bordetella pertussis]|nr:Uncharacterised protein [Bordetella pertussis]
MRIHSLMWVCTSGRRSNSPDSGAALCTMSSGAPYCPCQPPASSAPTRCPPAELPQIVMRAGSPPYSAIWRCIQASARRFWSTMRSSVTAGASE